MTPKGFYFHYKHSKEGPLNNFAYEVIGNAKHSESGDTFVAYRPLYESKFLGKADFYVRPEKMFTETIIRDGKKVKRFRYIREKEIIKKLLEIKNKMYQN